MNGAGSRNKGSRFERDVAKAFSTAFDGEDLRRVPLSGGLDIRCDIYNPFDDTFPYFIECKYRESYRFQSISTMTSDLFGVFVRNQDFANASYLSGKYGRTPEPLVVFKGGDFKTSMVMTKIKPEWSRGRFFLFRGHRWVYHLSEFLEWCPKVRLNK